MVEQVVDTFGRIDILVNVAGILRDRMIFNMTEAEWDAVIAVHLKGTFNCTRAASIKMREQQGGRIISMSSVSALGVARASRTTPRPRPASWADLVDRQRARPSTASPPTRSCRAAPPA